MLSAAVKPVLERHPALHKIVCRVRSLLGLRSGNAMATLGYLQLREKQHRAALQSFRRALQAGTNHVDASQGIVELLSMMPPIETTGLESNSIVDHDRVPPVFDWKTTSFGFMDHRAEFCACFDRVLAHQPTNLWAYQKYFYLFGIGEFQLGHHYFLRSLDAQATLRKTRGARDANLRYLREVWTYNIGHLFGLDPLFKAQQLGWLGSERFVLASPRPKIANPAYLDCFRPFLDDVITEPDQVARLADEADAHEQYTSMLPLRGQWVSSYHALQLINRQWELEGRGPLLRLDEDIQGRGRDCLRQMGVPDGAWYVGLHVRENGFHKDVTDESRSAAIMSFEDAIKAVTQRGGWVIRMGDPSMTPMKPMPQVIDYAHHPLRSAWMDVFLCGSMRFFIGTLSGLAHVPHTFGVPSVLTNVSAVGFSAPWYSRDIFVPQLLHHEPSGRFLSLAETLRSGLGFVHYPHLFARKRVQRVQNTSEDIRQAVEEMLGRFDGVTLADDRQKKVQQIFESAGALCNGRVAGSFLDRHPTFLEAAAA